MTLQTKLARLPDKKGKTMKTKTASWRELAGEDRLCAHVERVATMDTIHGGAHALLLSKRLRAMGGTDLRHVVGAVYSASTGKMHREYGAFECPECGSAHLGVEAALACCCENFDKD